MPHFRVDDALHSHPKAQRAGDEAMGMWARAGSFCMAYLTDGFVPDWWVKTQPKGPQKARKLVAAGLWHGGAERDGETGYIFHEFVGPGRQDSREQIEADRVKWRKKKARQRETSREESPSASLPVSQGDTAGDTRESPGYTQHQHQHQPLSVVTSGGDLTNATRATPHCPKHPNGTDRPCGACADARRALDDWKTERAAALSTFWAEVRSDPDCDERGYLESEAGRLRRCPNHDWEAIR